MAGPHTQFVQSFIEECVECLEQGSRGSILQFMPFTMVSHELAGDQTGKGASGTWRIRGVASDVIGKDLEISPLWNALSFLQTLSV